jgi:hypothetical protein
MDPFRLWQGPGQYEELNNSDLRKVCSDCLQNVILSPSTVILSEAKNLLLAQGKLREGSRRFAAETLRSQRAFPHTAPVSLRGVT